MNVLIVDDHALFREGLRYVLEKLDDEVAIHEAPDFDRAFQLLKDGPAMELILLDLNLSGRDGFAVLRHCLEQYPTVPVAILSGSKKIADMRRVMDMGAAGFIAKDTTSDVMLNAVRMILAGAYYIPQALLRNPQPNPKSGDPFYLTERQLEVVSLICDGLTNKQIAKTLGIAEATIKMHVTSIFRSLEVTNRTQIAKVARDQGLVQSTD
ncbi:MAG: DNA-binding NarL/FixJ family response regulator [Gammaproteobacteria bacterium]